MTFIETKIQEAEELMQRNQQIQSWEDLSDEDLDRILYLSNRVFCEAAAAQRAGRLSEPISMESSITELASIQNISK